MTVDQNKGMLGAFAPQRDPHELLLEEETTPFGVLARGIYSAKLKVHSCSSGTRNWLLKNYLASSLAFLFQDFTVKSFRPSFFLLVFGCLQFEDDDKRCYLELDYSFEIKKR